MNTSAEAKAQRDAALALSTQYEALIADTLEQFHSRQMHVIVAKFRGPKARKGTKYWHPMPAPLETKALDIRKLISPRKWVNEIRSDVTRIISQLFRTASKRAGDAIPDDYDTPLQARVLRMLAIVESRAKYVADALDDVDSTSDGDVDVVLDRLAEIEDGAAAWAMRAAVTETTGSMNEAMIASAMHAGLTNKMWLSVRDNKVRLEHVKADGQTQRLGQPFVIGAGSLMMYPGDPAGPPGLVINCRCTLIIS